MREEKNRYTSNILTSKSPFDATEIFRVRLSQAKLINKEVHLLLKDVSELKQKYVQQLRRIVAIHEDLDKILYNEMVQTDVLTEDEMSRIDFDWLGNVRELWAHIIRGLKTEIHLKHLEYKSMEKDVLPPLLDFNTAKVNWKEVKTLHNDLTKVASNLEAMDTEHSSRSDLQLEWSEKAPDLLEGIETLDENRLVLLKRCLMQYQNLISDSLHSCLDENEKVLAALLEFSPTDEIEKFASAAASYSFDFKLTSSLDKRLSGNPLSQPSIVGGSRSRKSSTASAMKNMLADSFSDSSNNPSLHATRTSKLRSKVGSLFGRRKLKKSPQVQDTVIAESDSSSSSIERAKSAAISEATSKPPSKGSEPPVSKSAAASSPPGSDPTPPVAERNPAKVNKGLSIHQEPLKPRLRNNYSSEHSVATDNLTEQDINAVNPVTHSALGQPVRQSLSTNVYDGSGTSPTVSSPSQDSNDSRSNQPQIALPPPRKTYMPASQKMKKYDDSFHVEDDVGSVDKDSIFESRHRSRRSHSSPQDFPKGRQDTQASNFSNIPKSEYDRSVVRLSSFASTGTGDLRTLNPQMTGTNLSLSLSHGQGNSIFQHTELTSTGLNSSIGEVINARFKDGILVSSQLIGEIALNYFSADHSGDSIPLDINLKITSELPFERLIINNVLLEKSEAEDELVYRVDPQQIFHKTIGAVKYSLQTAMVPIVIHPVWKFEEKQASVMLTIKCLPALPKERDQLVLEDLIISVSIEDAVAKSALSKPQGSFSKEKKRITWRFKEQMILRRHSEERLIARFLTEGIARESSKGVQARFTIRDTQIPGKMQLQYQEISLDDPFGAGTAGIWNEVSTSRTLVAGSYYGLST